MNFFPSAQELILAFFTASLTFLFSIGLWVIQEKKKGTAKIQSTIKILVAQEEEIKRLSSGKTLSQKEIEDALDYLQNAIPSKIQRIDKIYTDKKFKYLVNVAIMFMISSFVNIFVYVGVLFTVYILNQDVAIKLSTLLVNLVSYGIQSIITFSAYKNISRDSKEIKMLKNELDNIEAIIRKYSELTDKKVTPEA